MVIFFVKFVFWVLLMYKKIPMCGVKLIVNNVHHIYIQFNIEWKIIENGCSWSGNGISVHNFMHVYVFHLFVSYSRDLELEAFDGNSACFHDSWHFGLRIGKTQ